MNTTFKLQLSFIGTAVKQALSTSPAIEIGMTPSAGELRPFKSLPAVTKVYTDEGPYGSEDDMLPRFSLKEVLTHDMPHDCWLIIYDRVYDLTNFLHEHPGGDEILLEYAGRDATLPFRSVGHSQVAETALTPYLIGILQDKDRLWLEWGRRGSR